MRLDVTSEAGWEQVIADTVASFGGLHILVNNAGLMLLGSVVDTTLEDFRKTIAVNTEERMST